MNYSNISRRALLFRALPAAATIAAGVCSAQSRPVQCIDPDELTDSQLSLGASLRYTDRSADAAKTCKGCAYFHTGEPIGCGRCDILNRPVNATGHCASWSAKE